MLAIFVADLMTDLEIVVAVLYVAVVLLAALFYSQRIVISVSIICVVLTFVSYALGTRGDPYAGIT